MNMTSFPCHDFVLVRASFRRGEIINNDGISMNVFDSDAGKLVMPDGSRKKFCWFFESGKHTHENLETGAIVDLVRGWSNSTSPHQDGLHKISCDEASVVWCFNEIANSALPEFDYHHVASGGSHTFSADDKWFLLSGSFTVDGVARTKPRSFVSSSQKTITFDEDSMFIVLR